jgi:hypothetical protein
MNIAPNHLRPWYLSITLAAVSAVVLIHSIPGRADDTGLYGGRALLSGVPASAPKNQAELALEPGSAALGADAARLEGERIFGGYRFGPGFALEGAQTRLGPSSLAPGNGVISVAGVSSVPLSDSVTLLGKLGLNYQTSAPPGVAASLSDVASGGRLYGVGLAVQVRDNIEVRAQTEHLGRPANAAQGPTASDSVLFGANVRF